MAMYGVADGGFEDGGRSCSSWWREIDSEDYRWDR